MSRELGGLFVPNGCFGISTYGGGTGSTMSKLNYFRRLHGRGMVMDSFLQKSLGRGRMPLGPACADDDTWTESSYTPAGTCRRLW